MNNRFYAGMAWHGFRHIQLAAMLFAALLGALASRAANLSLLFDRQQPDYFPAIVATYRTLLVDLNHDGRPDLIRGGNPSVGAVNSLAVALGNGNGGFAPSTYYAAGASASASLVADFNQDTHPDVLVANLSSASFSVFLGNGNGTMQEQIVTSVTKTDGGNTIGFVITSAAATDFNKDGKLDLILTGYFGFAREGWALTLVGNGDGTFTSRTDYETSPRTLYTATKSVAAADFNGDTYPDFIVANPDTGPSLTVFTNNQNGTFTRLPEIMDAALGNFPGTVTTADFNGDGRADIAFTCISDPNYGSSFPGHNVAVGLGNGDATFAPFTQYSAGSTADYLMGLGTELSVADMDGDGIKDLATIAAPRSGSQGNVSFVSILRGAANGTFTPGAQFTAAFQAFFMAVGQLNGDTEPDVVVTGTSSSLTEIYLARVGEARSLVVTTTNDTFNGYDQSISLREALAYAGTLSGPQTITFAPSLTATGPATVRLAQLGFSNSFGLSALAITGAVTIQGPTGSNGITVAGISNGLRHFWVETSGALTVAGLTFTGGTTANRGASICSRGTLTISGCTFVGNSSGLEGGAVHCLGGALSMEIRNSTFASNSAATYGGAIVTGAATNTLIHVTIVDNTSGNGAYWQYESQATFINTIVARNFAANETTPLDIATFGSGGFTTQSAHNLIGPGGGGNLVNGVNGNIVGLPASSLGLGRLANHGGPTPTVALLSGSPALNGGTATTGPLVDQRGFPRTPDGTGGLFGRYYSVPSGTTTALLSPLSNLEALTPAATVLTPRVDFGTGTEAAPGDGTVLDRTGSPGNPFGGLGVNLGTDNLAALWTGYLHVPETASYRFTSRSDDGSVLYVNDQLVVNNNSLQAMNNAGATVSLAAGWHYLRIGYFEGGGDSGIQASWEQLTGTSPFTRRIIAPSSLWPGATPDIGAFESQRIAPAITSASQITFLSGQTNTFVVSATGDPVPTFSYTGTLPPGVSLTPAGVLSGAPVVGSDGVYPVVITASNSVLPNAAQSFTLTVAGLPSGTILVNSTNDPAGYDSNLTVSTLGAAVTLRDAFTAANNTPGAQTIMFAPSLAGATILLTQVGDSGNGPSALAVTSEIVLDNTTPANITLARGIAGDLRHFDVKASGNLTVRNLTLTNGQQSFGFGGIIANSGTLVVDRCTLAGGRSGRANNPFTGEWGGGAIYNLGNATITSSTITSCVATRGGGAIYNRGGTLSVAASTFSYNVHERFTLQFGGGAIFNWGAAASITNSTFAFNSTEGVGGAIFALSGSPLTLVHCTVKGNTTARFYPGIIANDGALTRNCIFADASIGLSAGNNYEGDPGLGAFAANGGPTATFPLSAGSSAIGAGAFDPNVLTDQRGLARHNPPDIGAYEFVIVPAPQFTPPGGTYEGSLTITLATSVPGATIRYTTDGSTPTQTHGDVYAGSFSLWTSATVKAITVTGGGQVSRAAAATYTLQTGLAAWRALHGLLADGSQDPENPAGDGVANLFKYAFNLAPTTGTLVSPNRAVLSPNGTAGLPSITVNSQHHLVFQFVRRKASSNPGIGYVVSSSADLTTWTPLDLGTAMIESIDSVWERVTITDTNSGPHRFGRVGIIYFSTYRNDFNAALGAATLHGTAVWTNEAVMLTDTIGGQLGAVVFDGITTSPAVNGFTARFNTAIGPAGTGTPADGINFAVGTFGNGAWGEVGPGGTNTLSLGFDTYNNGGVGDIGIHVWLHGVHIASSTVNPFTAGALVPVEISYQSGTGVTVRFNGATIFNQVPTPGFVLPAGGRFGIGARTGGHNERAIVDDVEITAR